MQLGSARAGADSIWLDTWYRRLWQQVWRCGSAEWGTASSLDRREYGPVHSR